jgi:hypothetical protein
MRVTENVCIECSLLPEVDILDHRGAPTFTPADTGACPRCGERATVLVTCSYQLRPSLDDIEATIDSWFIDGTLQH